LADLAYPFRGALTRTRGAAREQGNQLAEGAGAGGLAEGGAAADGLVVGAEVVPAEDGEGDGLEDADGEALGEGDGVVDGEGVGELVVGTEVGDGDGDDREGVADGDRSPGGCVGRGAGEPWNAARTTRNPPTRSRNTRNATTAATHRPPRGGGGGGGAAASMTSVPGESGASTAVVEPSRIGVAATGSPCMARSRSSRISSAVV